jgi:hypothetical protein
LYGGIGCRAAVSVAFPKETTADETITMAATHTNRAAALYERLAAHDLFRGAASL